jgi:hypothetical protein
MDAEHSSPTVQCERVAAENINLLFRKYAVPRELDLLSIDIDGNDYWVWRALSAEYRPLVCIIEYNASYPPGEAVTIDYDRAFQWQKTDYFGASLDALAQLGESKGYDLAYCESHGVNAVFVRQDVNPFVRRPVAEIYREPDYAPRMLWGLPRLYWPKGRGHRRDSRRLVPVSKARSPEDSADGSLLARTAGLK